MFLLGKRSLFYGVGPRPMYCVCVTPVFFSLQVCMRSIMTIWAKDKSIGLGD